MAIINDFLDRKIDKNVFIQIGTFDGDDFFRDIIRHYRPRMTILVEPNPEMIPLIEKNYRGIGGVYIENVAIVSSPMEDVTLYLPQVDDNCRAANGYYYQPSKFSIKPMNDWGSMDEMHILHSKGMTAHKLFEKYRVRRIDFLCLDTEGYDSEIIKSIDLWKYTIDILQYENWNFDSTLFARHNEDWYNLGDVAMDTVRGMLSLRGYDLYDDETKSNTIAINNRKEAWINEGGDNM